MKKEATKKYIQPLFWKNIIPIGYCNAQFLLHGREPMWYTTFRSTRMPQRKRFLSATKPKTSVFFRRL